MAPSITERAEDQLPVPQIGDGPVDLEGFRLVKAANEALDRVNATGDDWLIVAEAYQHGRRLAMAEAHTNEPAGKAYNAALAAWSGRTQFSLDRIDKYERRDLARIMENRPAFDAWRATLTANQCRVWNHPTVMWRRFSATQAKGGTSPTLRQKARPSLRAENEQLKAELSRAREELDSPNAITITRKDSAKDIAATLVGAGFTDGKLEKVVRLILDELHRRRSSAQPVAAVGRERGTS